MKSRIFLKAMAAFAAVILAATLTVDFSVRRTWENSLRNDVERLLLQNVEAFALRVQNDQRHSLQAMAAEESRITETRTTIIARDGAVLADSEADPKTMENHAGRPEVAAALQGKVGIATSCGIYAIRPEVCRTCMPGDAECAMARKKHGLPALSGFGA